MTIHRYLIGLVLMVGVCGAGSCVAQVAGTAGSAPAITAQPQSPQVPDAAPGVYSSQKHGANRIHLSVTGHTFTSREAIERYLAYRAAELTKGEHDDWFTLIERRTKGDTAPLPKPDPTGPRFSFRMDYWRPAWRYKTAASPGWKSWSPFSSTAFFATDAKTIAAYEASADIVLHKGKAADNNPLAFDAEAVSDFLVNQVSPPQ